MLTEQWSCLPLKDTRMSWPQQAFFMLALLAGACNLPIVLAVQIPLAERRNIPSAIQSRYGETHHGNLERQADGLWEKGGRRSERSMLQENTAAGASADDDFYQNYASLSEYVDQMLELQRRFPDEVSVSNLPQKTFEGRDIHVMTINSKARSQEKILLTALQHSREWISGMSVMYIAEALATRLARNDTTSHIDQYEYILIPVVNPDGLEFTTNGHQGSCSDEEHHKGNCDRLWRKNRRKVTFRSRCHGVDLNRNWPLDFSGSGKGLAAGAVCDETFHGEGFFSEPETLGICEFLAEATGEQPRDVCSLTSPKAASGRGDGTIVAAMDFHSYGQIVLGGWGHTNQPTRNAAKGDDIGMRIVEGAKPEVFLYGTGDAEGMSYLASGTLPDWLHYTFSTYAYTVELPPLTWDLGGFHLASHLISKACSASYQMLEGMLEGLAMPLDASREPTSAVTPESYEAQDCSTFNATLQVEIQPDLYPAEIAWDVTFSSGDVLVRWARTRYGPTTDYAGLTAHGGSILICKPGVYMFVLRDKDDDGLCCEHGSGGISLSLDGKKLHIEDGDFTSHATVAIKVDLDPVARSLTARTDAQELISNMEAALQLPEAREPPPVPPISDYDQNNTPEAEFDGNMEPVNTPDSTAFIAPVPDAINAEQLSSPMNETANATAAPKALDQPSDDEADRNSTSGRMAPFSKAGGMTAVPKDPESSTSLIVIAVAGGFVFASLAALLVIFLAVWRWKRGAPDRPSKVDRLPSNIVKSNFSDDSASLMCMLTSNLRNLSSIKVDMDLTSAPDRCLLSHSHSGTMKLLSRNGSAETSLTSSVSTPRAAWVDSCEKPLQSSAHQACCAVDAHAAAVVSNQPQLKWETATERDLYSCHAALGTEDAGRQTGSNQSSPAHRSIIDEVDKYGGGAAAGDSICTLSHDVPIQTSFLNACREAAEAFNVVSCAPGVQGGTEANQNGSGHVALSPGTEAEEKQVIMPEPAVDVFSVCSNRVDSKEKEASPQQDAADTYTAANSNQPDLGRQTAMGRDLYSFHVDPGIEDMGRQTLFNEPRPAHSCIDEVNQAVNEYGDHAAAYSSIHALSHAAEAFDLAPSALGKQVDTESRQNDSRQVCLSSGTEAEEKQVIMPEPTSVLLHQRFKPPQLVPPVMASLPTNDTQTSTCSKRPGRADHLLIGCSDEDCEMRESSNENKHENAEEFVTTDTDGSIAANVFPNPSSEAADLVPASSAAFMTTSVAVESENDSCQGCLLREESRRSKNFDEDSCLDDRSSSTFSLPPALYQESLASIDFSQGDEDETALGQCSDMYNFNADHEHEGSRALLINGRTTVSEDEDDGIYLDNDLGHGWSRFSITASDQCSISSRGFAAACDGQKGSVSSINDDSTVVSEDEDDGVYLDNSLGHGWSRFSMTEY